MPDESPQPFVMLVDVCGRDFVLFPDDTMIALHAIVSIEPTLEGTTVYAYGRSKKTDVPISGWPINTPR